VTPRQTRYQTIEPLPCLLNQRVFQTTPTTLHPAKMEALATYIPPHLHSLMEHLEPHSRWLPVALLTLATIYLTTIYVSYNREAPVPFNVPLPPEIRSNYNWTGKSWDDVTGEQRQVLEGQARGQWDKNLIMSYCPADGRVLGSGIKPATREVVERAIEAAAGAQVEWARTGFAERRRVLRTLLRSVHLVWTGM